MMVKLKRFFNIEMIVFSAVSTVMIILLATVGAQFFKNLKILRSEHQANSKMYTFISVLYFSVLFLLVTIVIVVYVARYKYVKVKNVAAKNLTNLTIEQAASADVNETEAFFNQVIDFLDQNGNYPCWVKGVYPARDYIEKCVDNNEMFIVRNDGKIVGAYSLSYSPNGDYSMGRWQKELCEGEYMVVHSLAVSPDYFHQNIASYMIKYAIDTAKTLGAKALRLDCTLLNGPAMHLFESLGFVSCVAFDLGRDVLGASRFQLYEYLLEEKSEL